MTPARYPSMAHRRQTAKRRDAQMKADVEAMQGVTAEDVMPQPHEGQAPILPEPGWKVQSPFPHIRVRFDDDTEMVIVDTGGGLAFPASAWMRDESQVEMVRDALTAWLDRGRS